MNKDFRLNLDTYKKILKIADKYNFNKFDLITNYGLFSGDTNLFKTLTIHELLKRTQNVKGDIIEFGIWRGNTSLLIKKIIDIYNIKKRLIMFDHFRGLQHFEKKDGKKIKKFKGTYLGNKKIIKEFLNFFKFKNIKIIDKDATSLNENYFKGKKFSMVIIDVDLYEPTLKILNSLKNNIQKNGLIVFDEGNSKLMPGEGIALKEFLNENKRRFKLEKISFSRQPDIILKKIT
mgnify:FL=1|tara:strand:- start:175 stop:873 length:699 start_codon:yes stop_codon:yes gene_type:complete